MDIKWPTRSLHLYLRGRGDKIDTAQWRRQESPQGIDGRSQRYRVVSFRQLLIVPSARVKACDWCVAFVWRKAWDDSRGKCHKYCLGKNYEKPEVLGKCVGQVVGIYQACAHTLKHTLSRKSTYSAIKKPRPCVPFTTPSKADLTLEGKSIS